MKPYYDAVKSGMDAEEAWTNTQQQISASTKYGTWRRDLLVHKASPTDDDNRYCDYHEIKCATPVPSCRLQAGITAIGHKTP